MAIFLFPAVEDNRMVMESDEGENGLSMGRGIHRDRANIKRKRRGNDDDDENDEDDDEFDGKSKGARSSFSKYTTKTRMSGVSDNTRMTGKTGRTMASAKTSKTQNTQRTAPGSEYRSKVSQINSRDRLEFLVLSVRDCEL